ncbi:MAG: type IV pilus modification protein PilV [Pseudomonadaceae bacterium]|nr:type IV pilus modification protein PilV [Pseudomonadaceae bacterium]
MPLIISSRNQGFTLLEVLISMLILAIGLLGMAALMMSNLQANQGAALRSTATILSYDIADRIRSNVGTVATRTYPDTTPADAVLPACHTDPLGCGPTDRVQEDLAQWNASLLAIPGATGLITRINDNNYCIAIFWTEPAEAEALARSPCGQDAAGRAFVTMNIELIKRDVL